MKWKKRKQRFALFAVVVLAAMYIINLVLALIGTEWARNLLKGTMVTSLMIPIILFGFLVAMKHSSRFRKDPEDELTEDEKEKIYELLEKEEVEKQKKVPH